MRNFKRLMCMLLCLGMLAGFIPVSASAAGSMPFTDVPADAWYRDAVQYVYDNGIMNGVAADKFAPESTTTRGMIVTVLHRMEGEPAAMGENFTDVAADKYYAMPVAWASSMGIVNGYGYGKFGPEDPITREQLATILYRYSETMGMSTSVHGDLSVFNDSAATSAYAVEAMSWAVGMGLIFSVGNSRLAPTDNATRAQVAVSLSALLTSRVQDAEEPSGSYGIFDLSVNGSSVTAAVSTMDECSIAIEVLDESGKRLYADSFDLSGNIQLGSVELATGFNFPENFIISAVLTDSRGSAMCNKFVCRDYTESYREFAAKTEADYDSEHLIDLAGKNDGSFALLHDDVIMLSASPVSEENGTSVFSADALADIELKKGDKICFVDANGKYATVKIAKVELRGDKLSVSADNSTYISDFYKTIKIDTLLLPEGDLASAHSLSAGSGSSAREWLSDMKMGSRVNNSFSTPFGSFGHSTSVGGKMEIIYDFELFGKDYIEVTMVAGIDTELSLEIGPNKKISDSLEIASIPLAGIKDIADIPMEISLNYEIDCDAGLNTTVNMEAAMGVVYNTLDGSQKVEEKNIAVGEMYIEGEVEAKFGLDASIKASLLDDKLSIGLGAEGGVGWSGKAKSPSVPLPGSDSYHACGLCVDGTTFGFFEVDLSSDCKLSKKLSGNILDIDFLYLQWTICRFYVSLINEPESVHRGELKFDFGDCPNKKYRGDFSTFNNGEEETGVSVTIRTKSANADAGASPYRTYLYPGDYAALATIDGKDASKSFSVVDSPVAVRLSVQDYKLSGTVSDKKSGEPISGAGVSVRNSDGELVADAFTDASGKYSLMLPEGEYSLGFSAEDYESAGASVTLSADSTMNAALKKIEKPGTLDGVITDKNTGDPISGASITATADDGSSISASTDPSGRYAVELPSGKNYTLSFTAEGYIGESAALEVEDSGEYHISKALRPNTRKVTIEVVTWGRPYAGATVEIPGIGTYTTGSNGQVTIDIPESVADGSYLIIARTRENYGNATLKIPGSDFIRVDAFMLIHIH